MLSWFDDIRNLYDRPMYKATFIRKILKLGRAKVLYYNGIIWMDSNKHDYWNNNYYYMQENTTN